jgi:hypothetical protein
MKTKKNNTYNQQTKNSKNKYLDNQTLELSDGMLLKFVIDKRIVRKEQIEQIKSVPGIITYIDKHKSIYDRQML